MLKLISYVCILVLLEFISGLSQVQEDWVARYDGPGNSPDLARDVSVDDSGFVYVCSMSGLRSGHTLLRTTKHAPGGTIIWSKLIDSFLGGKVNALEVDRHGNVYVTGTENADFFTVKYSPQGETLWTRQYAVPLHKYDEANDISVDTSGNVYVTGKSDNSGYNSDYLTVKYDSLGTMVWARLHSSTAYSYFAAMRVIVDSEQNILISGRADGTITTFKFAPNGDTLWVRSFAELDHYSYFVDMKMDEAGSVYLAGYSTAFSQHPKSDFLVIKYSSSGVKEWTRKYTKTSNSSDRASALAIDINGNIVISGNTSDSTFQGNCVTLKYNPAGDLIWGKIYDEQSSLAVAATSIDTDRNGNIVIGGYETSAYSAKDYLTVKYDSLGNLLWTKTYRTRFDDMILRIHTGPNENVVVVGSVLQEIGCFNCQTGNMLAIDYDSGGNLIWQVEVNGEEHGDEIATDLEIDSSGFVYVTGYGGTSTEYDYVTIMYSPQGDPIWIRRYTDSIRGTEYATGLEIDNQGNVYVTGYSGAYPDFDWVTIKYDNNGSLLWKIRNCGPANDFDTPANLRVDDSGNIYVTGTEIDGDSSKNIATIKYDRDGNTLWKKVFDNGPNSDEYPVSLEIDTNGDLYVVGLTGTFFSQEYIIIKYNSHGGTIWTKAIAGPISYGFNPEPDFKLDNLGNAYLAGFCLNNGNTDYLLIKFNSPGDTLWTKTYNGSENKNDLALAVAIDSDYNVYLTGHTHEELTTIKYSPAGDLIWTKNFTDCGFTGNPTKMSLDESGDVYVMTYCECCYVSVKYSSHGDSLWTMKYPQGGYYHVPNAFRVDKSKNVFVTGRSAGAISFYDFATVKYTQSIAVSANDEYSELPGDFKLSQNFPNPFNPSTVIEYSLPYRSHVTIEVFNLLGQCVRKLVNESKPAGNYQVEWDGTDGHNSVLASGIYLYRLQTEDFKETKKMLFIK
jgi:uncharacterized delta-60 repeat protein